MKVKICDFCLLAGKGLSGSRKSKYRLSIKRGSSAVRFDACEYHANENRRIGFDKAMEKSIELMRIRV